uniref:Apple domain-containing protein n=1 Tax=Meloidogyne hapla TaxID=6305 RepID=A0A1I8BET6_MELHA
MCNTKDLFDNTLFCLNKGKEKNYKKAIKQCNEECFVYRDNDGNYKKHEFHYNCGRCPVSNELFRNTSDVSLSKKLIGIEINEIQCADCNNSPLCNNETFFEEQLFCLEKTANETKVIKGTRVCKNKCFVSRNYTTGNCK